MRMNQRHPQSTGTHHTAAFSQTPVPQPYTHTSGTHTLDYRWKGTLQGASDQDQGHDE